MLNAFFFLLMSLLKVLSFILSAQKQSFQDFSALVAKYKANNSAVLVALHQRLHYTAICPTVVSFRRQVTEILVSMIPKYRRNKTSNCELNGFTWIHWKRFLHVEHIRSTVRGHTSACLWPKMAD